jgi:hypothetical protein
MDLRIKEQIMRSAQQRLRLASRWGVVMLALAASAAGCATAGQGAVSGAAVGAVGGLAIGAITGDVGEGAAIGAIGGAVVGGVIGDQNRRAEERQQQIRYSENPAAD